MTYPKVLIADPKVLTVLNTEVVVVTSQSVILLFQTKEIKILNLFQ